MSAKSDTQLEAEEEVDDVKRQLGAVKEDLKAHLSNLMEGFERRLSNKMAGLESCFRKEMIEQGSMSPPINGMYKFPDAPSLSYVDQQLLSEMYKQKHPESYVWTITDLDSKVHQRTFEVKTEVFSVQGYDFGAQAKLYFTDEARVLMWVCFVNTKNSSERFISHVKSFPKVTFVLCSWADDGVSGDAIRTCNCDFKEVLCYDHFYYGVYLPDKYKLITPTYNLYDAIKIKILIEPPFLAKSSVSNVGKLNWVIDDYYEKKKMEEDELVVWQESPYFYTGPQGYRIQILLRLNGHHEGQGSGLTAYVWFLTGEFDHLLSKSFAHKTTFIIINSNDSSKNLVKSIEKDTIEKKGYYMNLESTSVIETCGFVNDNVLKINIDVEATN